MEASIIADPVEFRRRAAKLLADEARHNLMLGITGTLLSEPAVYPDYRLFLVEDRGEPVAAASITHPHNLVLADSRDPAAITELVRLVAGSGARIPGATGNRPTIEGFVAEWSRLTGQQGRAALGMGVYALRVPANVPTPAGRPRLAVPSDENSVVDWIVAFSAEALPHEQASREDITAMARRRMRGVGPAAIWLWEADSGYPVAMSGHGSPTGTGIRISLVYTPPEQRGRGYATALVSAQSAWLLDNGYQFCFLFTDLANPTSNAIYERIGYERVATAASYTFAVTSLSRAT